MKSSSPPNPPAPQAGDPEDPAGAPGTSNEQTEAIARQRALGRHLRAMFNEVTDEPVPQNFLDLLDELERKEERG
jgi:hypothetical protein